MLTAKNSIDLMISIEQFRPLFLREFSPKLRRRSV